VSVSILVNQLTLCHKGDSGGTVTATVPDVCKTPPNAIPIPYPNIAFAADLAGGTTTVFVDGGNMAAHSASVFSKSMGDEPGMLGGVKSGVNMAEASWLNYSMDVFLEGLNACRLTDKMLLNHGNTVSMGGFLTDWLKAWVDAARGGNVDCDKLLEMIDKILNGNKGAGTAPTPDTRGVKERFWDQINGEIKPGEPGWDNHNKALRDMQEQLEEHLRAYGEWCGGGPPIPVDAWKWATKPLPDKKDYEGPEPEPSRFSLPHLSAPVVVGIVVVAGAIAVAVFPPAAAIFAL
jgi:hypothetical protein